METLIEKRTRPLISGFPAYGTRENRGTGAPIAVVAPNRRLTTASSAGKQALAVNLPLR
jgi:hypothetical protein